MNTFIRPLFLAGIAAFLAACATIPNESLDASAGEASENYREERLPPVSLFYAKPSEKAVNECRDFDKKSVLHHCAEDFFKLETLQAAFTQSDRFAEVKLTERDVPYTVATHFSYFNHESAKELGNAALSGATLLLLPVVVEGSMKAELTLAWQGQALFSREYILPFNQKLSLVSDPNAGATEYAQALVRAFLEDADEKALFSASRVAEALGATDYDSEITPPELIEGYAIADTYTYRSPFLGKLFRYQHEQFPQDFIDVFVYPIRDHQLDNANRLVNRELEAAMKEAELFAQQNELPAPKFSVPKPLPNGGRHIEARVQDSFGQAGVTHLIVYAKGDQFIKLRATFADTGNLPNPVPFATTLETQIQAPEQSPFMTSMRERWRSASIGDR